MMKTQEEIIRMITEHLLGNLSEQEEHDLAHWCGQSPANMAFFKQICSSTQFAHHYRQYKEIDQQKAFSGFVRKTNIRLPFIKKIEPFLKYAAVLLVLLAVGAMLYINQFHRAGEPDLANSLIPPGQSKAILVLGNGSRVALNGNSTQHIQSGNKLLATNTASGIFYDRKSTHPADGYNTLAVPRGGEYRVTLSDGTVVHLNSASELKYPAGFQSGKPREVYLKGEGYFDVAKNPGQAFVVHVGGIKVKQYGTAFNINAQNSGHVKVVLVRGSIGVSTSAPGSERKLKVSQLAEYDAGNQSFTIKTVDVRSYVAWNEGMFNFEDEDLDKIMQTLSLWYDVDIHFSQNDLKNLRFTGSISRSVPVNDILNAIGSTTDVKMEIKDRKIYVGR